MKEIKGIIKQLKKNNGHIKRIEVMDYLYRRKGYKHFGVYTVEGKDTWVFWKKNLSEEYTTEAICFVGHDTACENLSYEKLVLARISVQDYYWGRRVTVDEVYKTIWEKE